MTATAVRARPEYALPPVTDVALSDIRPGENHRLEDVTGQPETKGLAENLARWGMCQPVGLVRDKSGAGAVLIWGYRRFAAARLAKMPTLPARVFDADFPLEDRAALAAIENTQRVSLNAIEEHLAITRTVEQVRSRLIAHHYAVQKKLVEEPAGAEPKMTPRNPTPEEELRSDEQAYAEAARHLGQSPTWVRDRDYLGRLSKKCRGLVVAGRLTLAQAREIAKLTDEARQDEVAWQVAKDERLLGGESLERTKGRVEKYTATLHGVPWRLDVAFAGAVACGGCPNNSANVTGLFEHDKSKAPHCVLRTCYQKKRTAANGAMKRSAERLVALRVAARKKPKEGEQREAVPTTPAALVAAKLCPPYVDPLAVFRRAKMLNEDGRVKGGTGPRPAAQRREADPEHDWNHPVNVAMREADGEWNAIHQRRRGLLRGGLIAKAKDPEVRAALVCLFSTATWHGVQHRRHESRLVESPALTALFREAIAGNLKKVAKEVDGKSHLFLGDTYQFPNFAGFDAIAKDLGVELPELPDQAAMVAAARDKAREKVKADAAKVTEVKATNPKAGRRLAQKIRVKNRKAAAKGTGRRGMIKE